MGAVKDDKLETRLVDLGNAVATATDNAEESERVIEGARARLQQDVLARRGARNRPALARTTVPAWTWASAAAALLVAGWLAWPTTSEPLSVTLETHSAPLVGSWVASGDATKQLRFSDGTSVSLHPNTKLRVDETTEQGARIVLGEGRTLARIEPKVDARWRFLAGPFTVRVTGTEFDLAWNPGTGVLELALHQGSVELSGPTLEGHRKVAKGEFVRVVIPTSQSDVRTGKGAFDDGATSPTRDAGPTGDADPTSDAGPTGNADPDSNGGKDAAGAPTNQAAKAGSGKWQTLLAQGKGREALMAIEGEGVAQALAHAQTSQLWSISRAARVHGRASLAKDALLVLRNKHGARGQTSYLLGKVYADQLHTPGEAIRWFETYLTEEPNGALAEQALGRLVELQAGTSRGRRAARTYLEKYPSGSYADFARSSLP